MANNDGGIKVPVNVVLRVILGGKPLKYKWVILAWAWLVLIPQLTCAKEDDFPILRGPYLGQTAPHDTADVFLDGIVSLIHAPENGGYYSIGERLGSSHSIGNVYKEA